MYQCVVCGNNTLTNDQTLFCCDRLTQWVCGLDGRGMDMKSPMVKIHVSGYVTMSKENLERILSYDKDHVHTALVYSLHMGYVDSSNLVFDTD